MIALCKPSSGQTSQLYISLRIKYWEFTPKLIFKQPSLKGKGVRSRKAVRLV